MKKSLDIIIPVHNALEHLKVCVDTVYQHTKDFRLILVDDCSDADTKAYLQTVVARNESNLMVQTVRQKWFSRACNLGFRLVRTDRCILLNSDCIVNEGWIEELAGVWSDLENTGHKVGLVGAYGDPGNAVRYVTTSKPNYVTGHCWFCNMHAFSEVAIQRNTHGYFFNERDPMQVHINSDRIFCHELNELGYTTASAFKVPVGHEGGKSWGHNLDAVAKDVPHLGVLD